MTPETVFLFRAGSPGERRSRFAVNPTTGALKAPADLRLEARKALLQHSRGMEVRLYLSLARHYVREFMFQMDGALLGVAADLRGKLPDFHHVGHYLSPVMGQTNRGAWTASASSRNRRPVGSMASPDPGDRGWGSSPVQRSRSAPTRSHSKRAPDTAIIVGLHFAFANELRHCRGKGAARIGKRLSAVVQDAHDEHEKRDDRRRHLGREILPQRRRMVLAGCILASSMAFIDGSALTVALPKLRAAVGADLASVQWGLNGYVLALASLTLIGGALADAYPTTTW
jgi:hypothetical protein